MLLRAIVLFVSLCFQHVIEGDAKPPQLSDTQSQEERDYALTMQAGNRCGFNLRCQTRRGQLFERLKSRPFFQRLQERRANRGCK